MKDYRYPKYFMVKKAVLDYIKQNNLEPGEPIFSLTYLMEKYGVSKVTAVRAMAELESEGVVERIHGRGTFVARKDAPAREEQRARKMVSIVVPDMSNPFYGEVVCAAERQLRSAGIVVELFTTDFDVESEGRTIRSIIQEKLTSGVILCPSAHPHDLEDRLFELPLVLIGSSPAKALHRCHLITSDNFRGGYEATSHLLALGHRRIGKLTNADASPERLEGYRQALRDAGDEQCVEHILMVDQHKPVGNEVIDFVRREELTAIFAVNDMTAMQVIQVLRKQGYAIPRDLSIVGYDDIASARYLDVPLTTIDCHAGDTGLRAADIMIESLQADQRGMDKLREILLMPRLIARASTGPPPRREATSAGALAPAGISSHAG